MALFIADNLLSAAATSIGMLAIACFISGMPQGAYFGDRGHRAASRLLAILAIAVGNEVGSVSDANLTARMRTDPDISSPPRSFLAI